MKLGKLLVAAHAVRAADAACASVKPDCSAVNDAMLASTMDGLWPDQRHIPYSFHMRSAVRWRLTLIRQGYVELAPRNVSSPIVRAKVEAALLDWQLASDSQIGFKYVPVLGSTQPGIFIAKCATMRTMTHHYDFQAITDWIVGDDGQIKGAIVCYPDDLLASSTDDPYENYMVTHELGHALGMDHFHESPDIQQILSEASGGEACSVMAYPQVVNRNFSWATDGSLVAKKPGPLDRRWLQLAYGASHRRELLESASDDVAAASFHGDELNKLGGRQCMLLAGFFVGLLVARRLVTRPLETVCGQADDFWLHAGRSILETIGVGALLVMLANSSPKGAAKGLVAFGALTVKNIGLLGIVSSRQRAPLTRAVGRILQSNAWLCGLGMALMQVPLVGESAMAAPLLPVVAMVLVAVAEQGHQMRLKGQASKAGSVDSGPSKLHVV